MMDEPLNHFDAEEGTFRAEGNNHSGNGQQQNGNLYDYSTPSNLQSRLTLNFFGHHKPSTAASSRDHSTDQEIGLHHGLGQRPAGAAHSAGSSSAPHLLNRMWGKKGFWLGVFLTILCATGVGLGVHFGEGSMRQSSEGADMYVLRAAQICSLYTSNLGLNREGGAD